MPAKRKKDLPIGVGLTAKQMKRRKPINTELMRSIDPLTDNQQKLFDAYSCLLYTSPSPRDMRRSRMPSSA